jgi:formamidopyrimidine-DNA glycosylase
MPELPEVESARLKISKAANQQTIKKVTVAKDPLVFDRDSAKAISDALTNAKITGTDRRGKYFWLKLNRKPWLVIHFGMSGSATILTKTEVEKAKPKPSRSIKLQLTLSNGTEIILKDPRRFGRIRLAKDPLHEKPISELGFDPMFNFPTAKVLHGILSKRKAPIKAVLLDQSVFSGVGNWIADEILYQSKLSPYRSATSLSQKEVTTLRSKLLSIIRFAVKVSADKDEFPNTWLFHHRWGKREGAKGKQQKAIYTSKNEKVDYGTVGGRTTAWVPAVQT